MRLKRYHKSFEHSYACGVFATVELLDARPNQVLSVILSSKAERNAGVDKIKRLCTRHCIPLETDDKAISRLSPKASHLAIGIFQKYRSRLDGERNHIVLVSPRDMGNLGAIARSMVGFGITDLALIRPAADIFDPRAVRASMGSLFSLSVEYFDAFEDYASRFNRNVYPFMSDGTTTIHRVHFEPLWAFVFGNESSGLPDSFLNVGTSVTIPHAQRIDSLNLATSVALALYESANQSGLNSVVD